MEHPAARHVRRRPRVLTQGLANAAAEDEFALTARRTLALATIDGARSLGLAEVTGSLSPGKRADLIVVSVTGPNLGMVTDPAQLLVTAAQPGNVDTVIADGRVLKRGGVLTALDAERIGRDARRALDGVIARPDQRRGEPGGASARPGPATR